VPRSTPHSGERPGLSGRNHRHWPRDVHPVTGAGRVCAGVHNVWVTDQLPHPPDARQLESLHEPVDHAQHSALKVRLARLEQLCGFGHPDAGDAGHYLPAWLRQTAGEHRIPVTIALVLIVGLQLSIPKELAFPPKYLLPSVEVLIYVALTVANPRRISRESRFVRVAGLLLVLAASVATAYSAGRLVYRLATGHGGASAVTLLLEGGTIWLTNVIVFALWYWEFDRGGPAARANARRKQPDFLFTQMTAPEMTHRDWEPGIVDYLYLSFTNATAFSPTDTMPLTPWAKLTMMFQSGISLVTVALVVARAVNIFT
jgi:uncharacterized membrane protein